MMLLQYDENSKNRVEEWKNMNFFVKKNEKHFHESFGV